MQACRRGSRRRVLIDWSREAKGGQGPVEMVEVLLGLNAQGVFQPYLSLWSWLQKFRKPDLELALLRFLVNEPTVEEWKVEIEGAASD